MLDVVFYSKRCAHSMKLIDTIRKMPFRDAFAYVSVDPDPATGKRNEELFKILQVDRVPTVYVDSKKYPGDEAFQWLNSQIMLFRQSQQQSQQPHYNQQQASPLYQPSQFQQNIPVQHSQLQSTQFQQQIPPPPQINPGGGLVPSGQQTDEFLQLQSVSDGNNYAPINLCEGDFPDRQSSVTNDSPIGEGNMQDLLRRFEMERNQGIPQVGADQRHQRPLPSVSTRG